MALSSPRQRFVLPTLTLVYDDVPRVFNCGLSTCCSGAFVSRCLVLPFSCLSTTVRAGFVCLFSFAAHSWRVSERDPTHRGTAPFSAFSPLQPIAGGFLSVIG